jgi:putative transposase
VLDQPRSTQRYESQPRSDEASLTKRMRALAKERPRFGYRRIARLLRREGWQASDTRVCRLWRREGLKVPQKKRKRRRFGTSDNGCHRVRAERRNDVWCWDFVFDRTVGGSSLKWLSIVDEYTRECLTLKVDRSITSEDVIDTLAELFALRCKRRPESVALGGEWWSVEKRSAQVITRGCRGRVSGFPENSDRADCGGQECSLTWSCGLRFAVGFRVAS